MKVTAAITILAVAANTVMAVPVVSYLCSLEPINNTDNLTGPS
jgi:hypothetical protein